jgi:hypothetical protein
MRPFIWLFVIAWCLSAINAGCGSNNPLGRKAIHGTVTLDGSPLERGEIELHPLEPTGVQSGGSIQAGKYLIAAPQGATPGKYRVVIYDTYETPPLPPGHMPGDDLPPAPKSKIPAEWNSKSKQEVEIKKTGPFKFDFDIATKKK